MQRSKVRGHVDRSPGRRIIFRLIAAAALLFNGALIAQAQQPPTTGAPGTGANPDRPYLIPEANRLPDVNDRMKEQEQKEKGTKFEAANKVRQRQIEDDAARLLQLATELKAEVDKTGKDTLSLNVIRKAETIEKLAKGVKEKMKLTVGPS